MSKRLKAAKGKIDQNKKYNLEEAIKLVKETSQVKFDATVELHCHLNIDPQKSDQQVRTSIKLPHSAGKKKKIAAFVSADKAKESKQAGAEVVGGEDLIDEIKKTGKADFDIAVAMPDMMAKMAVIAKILGQKGLMPNPKAGTITPDPAKVIKDLNQGLVIIKNDASGNIHLPVGKVSSDDKKLTANIQTFLDEMKKIKPDSLKGTFIRSVFLSSSMGPSVQLAV